MLTDEELDAVLASGESDDEADSALWKALCDWAWSYDPDEIPAADNMTAEMAAALLDDAAKQVPELAAPGAWASAARYFQAENLHGFVVPCCVRALGRS